MLSKPSAQVILQLWRGDLMPVKTGDKVTVDPSFAKAGAWHGVWDVISSVPESTHATVWMTKRGCHNVPKKLLTRVE